MSSKNKVPLEAVLNMADTLQTQIVEGWSSVAQGMLTYARDLPTVEAFVAEVGRVESERRVKLNADASAHHWTDEDRRRKLRLPQSWSNAKSQIKRIWEEYGIHPKEFKTYYELRTRLTSLRDRLRQTPRRVGPDLPAPETKAGEAAKGMLERLWQLPDEYQARVIESANRLIDSYQEAAESIARAAAPRRQRAAAH